MSEHVTVAQYIVSRFADLGIKHAFGLPGDFAFPIDDAIDEEPRIEFVVCSNELNAGYAADGYARIHGAALIATTQGVGELSAINAVYGALAEKLPVFHLVGHYGLRLERTGRITHHTKGAPHAADVFVDMAAHAGCVAYKVRDPATLVEDLEGVIRKALTDKEPAYIAVPKDIGQMVVPAETIQNRRSVISGSLVNPKTVCTPYTDPDEIKHALVTIKERMSKAKKPLILGSYMLLRTNLQDKALEFVEKTNIPYALTSMDKSALPDVHPNFLGLYKGKISPQHVLDYVGSSDLVIDIGGVLFDDLSTGFSTSMIPKAEIISLGHKATIVGNESMNLIHQRPQIYEPCFFGDVLDALLAESDLPKFPDAKIPTAEPWPPTTNLDQGITYATIASTLQHFFEPDDMFVCEVGTVSQIMPSLILPRGCMLHNQTLWGSIGWATPATFGVCMAAPERRTILLTGDGSHQLTANELGAMHRYGADPIIVVVHNGLFGVEEFLERNKGASYNVLAPWRYAEVAAAQGCDGRWNCVTVRTVKELQEELSKARAEKKGAYIEAIMEETLLDPMASSGLALEYMDKPN